MWNGVKTGVLGSLARRVCDSLTDPNERGVVVECCGIVGYAGEKEAYPILLNGIKLLQNRGYDSCGVATLKGSGPKGSKGTPKGTLGGTLGGTHGGTVTTPKGSTKGSIEVTKYASRGTTSDCVDHLAAEGAARHGRHKVGIAHTRWATHGGKTDENAHPHCDWLNRIAVVHNGTIDNFAELREELQRKHKIPFKSQTDTEVIANLIGYYLGLGQDFQTAVNSALDRLRGTWGLLVMHRDYPNGFMCARHGSPLIVGAKDGQVFVASEPLALAEHTNEYVPLHDGDRCFVSREHGITTLQGKGRETHVIPDIEIHTDPTPFKHWTIREIYEQPRSLSRALNFGARLGGKPGCDVKLGGLDQSKEELLQLQNMVITGCGTSLHAGMLGQLLFQNLGCFNSVSTVDASELCPNSFARPHETTGLLCLSQSGETRDIVQALEVSKQNSVKCLSVVNAVGSLVSRMTGCGVYLNAGREVAVASTKAFTSQVAVLALMGCWFAQHRANDRSVGVNSVRKEIVEALKSLPVQAGQLLQLDSQCKKVAQKLAKANSMFVLGKGYAYPVALEAALKIKEIAYIHAEGYGGGQLKHGPFALLDADARTPAVLIILRDDNQPAMLNAAQQVKARGAKLVIVTDDPESVKDVVDNPKEDIISIPENGPLTAVNATIPLQLLAYHLAVLRGINPDKPRGLAKTVTVM